MMNSVELNEKEMTRTELDDETMDMVNGGTWCEDALEYLRKIMRKYM